MLNILRKCNPKLSIVLLVMLIPLSAQAISFAKITQHKVYLDNQFLHLQANASVQLSPEMKQTINYDIPLTFVWKIKIDKNRSWYTWDKELYDRELTRKLYFNRTLGQYALENVDNHKIDYYRSLDKAVLAMAKIDIINLLAAKKIQAGDLYTSSIRLAFKTKKLPAVMILRGIWSKNWAFDTGWHLKRFNL